MIDTDKLEAINYAYGHDAGDMLLRTPLDDIFEEIGEYYPEDYSYRRYLLFSGLAADIRQRVAIRAHELFCLGCNAEA